MMNERVVTIHYMNMSLPAGLHEACGITFTQWSKNGFFAPQGDTLP